MNITRMRRLFALCFYTVAGIFFSTIFICEHIYAGHKRLFKGNKLLFTPPLWKPQLHTVQPERGTRIGNNEPRLAPRSLKMHSGLTYGDNSVALVTGASRGIGKSIAETLAKAGVSKILCIGKEASSCGEVLKLVKAAGSEAYAYGVDVSNSMEVEAACKAILKEHTHVDILVNNAGITKDNLLLRMTKDDWESVINTNLNSAFYFASGLLRNMVKRKHGRIVNMASVVGISGNVGQANYAAAKAGLIGLTKSLAKEVASRGITVNAIAPGFIASAMTDKLPADVKDQIIKSIPSGRMGSPEDVAQLTAFLVSDQAGYINGKAIPVDGALL